VTAVKVRLIVLLTLAALMVFWLVAFGHWPSLGMSDGYD
jgi:hypothetical protein